MQIARRWMALIALVVFAAGCGSTTEVSDEVAGAAESSTERPVVVATTSVLGDVLENLVGAQFDVVTLMPPGADPHSFQPSAQDIVTIENASAVIVNGAAFEEGLLDVIEAAEGDGALVFEAISAVDVIEFGAGGHDDHDEHGDEDHDDEKHDDEHDEHGDEDHDDEKHDDEHDEHGDEDHDDEKHDEHGDEDHDDEKHDEHGDEDHDDEKHDDEHDEHGDEDHDDEKHDDEHDEHGDEDHHDHAHEAGSADPHFFADPGRMAIAANGIVEFLIANVDTVDGDALRADAAGYIAQLEALDEEVATTLAAVPEAKRVLVTNHQVFGYFAEQYDFEVVGTVIPSGSSLDGVSGQRLAELASLLKSEGVSVVFTDTSSSDQLAETLANEVGDVAVVALYSESLGMSDSEASTYVDMVRSNAVKIAGALSG